MSFTATRPLFSHKHPPSSRAWLQRQFRDPYVRERLGKFRSRSAFKLLELDEKLKFFQPDVNAVVDLGAAPGGWSQVAAGKLGWTETDVVGLPRTRVPMSVLPDFGLREHAEKPKHGTWSSPFPDLAEEHDPLADLDDAAPSRGAGRGTIVAVDLLRMLPIPGVKTVRMDFLSPEADDYITVLLKNDANPEGKADLVMSDMAANFSGNKTHDIESCLDISNAVIQFTRRHLRTAESMGRRKGGVLILKHFEHPLMKKFRDEKLKPYFNLVFNSKPDASRAESSEGYWLCMGYKGDKKP
ncbi:hypothetical protein AcV5_001827 [Taiwanofungus camphoratus]|nr:hypothetical protein AcV5_001827 [Antrodia cinnamomea]